MLPIESLLPLRTVEITLQFTEPTKIRAYHQPALTAWLRHFLPNDIDTYEHFICLDAPESGCTEFKEGDYYRFSLTVLAGGEGLLQMLLNRMQDMPLTVRIKNKKVPFRDNLKWISAHDLFTQNTVQKVSDLTPYSFAKLRQDAKAWQAMSEVTLRWLSPVRLLLPKVQRESRKDGQRFCHFNDELSFELLNDRLHDSLANLLRHRLDSVPPRQSDSSLRLLEADSFWLDFDYKDEKGRVKPMGGLLGTVKLDTKNMPIEQWCQWILGQYVGIGQRRVFGWGRYHLEMDNGQAAILRTIKANSLLDACDSEQLFKAYLHVSQDDNETDTTQIEKTLEVLRGKLLEGSYEVPPLQPKRIFNQEQGTLRILSVPPFLDRVLQRAVAQVLTPVLDSVMYHGSFGFRHGHSRHQAAEMVRQAHEAGYDWIFESDVEAFFDSIQWTKLQSRLLAILNDEPIVARVMAWMQAPVQRLGQLEYRSAGLPQGSPLSPVLANLMLDDFDHDLERLGLKLVRFADDFLVLCRSREQAEQVESVVRESLAEAGLTMNQDKTHVRSFEQGFRFLGFLFINGLVLDAGKEKPPQLAPQDPAETLDTPPPQAKVYMTKQERQQLGEMDNLGTMVFVTGQAAVVSSEQGRLQVTRAVEASQDKMPVVELSLAWKQVQAVILVGGQHHITTPALREAMAHDVPIHFADMGGEYQGSTVSTASGQENSELWLLQLGFFGDAVNCLQAANGLMKSRLLHQREVLRRRNLKGRFDEQLETLKRLANQASVCSSLDSLRGLEESGAKIYFQALQQVVPAEFEFKGRNRRLPQDPFNALLSLGYTILFAHIETIVRVNGLLPWVGVYHQPRGNHPVLVSDLIEPFRHLVERVALNMLDKKLLTVDDFVMLDSAGLRLKDEARVRYLMALSERFDTPFRGQQWDESATLHEHVQYLVGNFVAWINGESQLYMWRMH
jgi:group II intron reverse transcriptase/maturase/CRISPR-associated endonuclease Cas1